MKKKPTKKQGKAKKISSKKAQQETAFTLPVLLMTLALVVIGGSAVFAIQKVEESQVVLEPVIIQKRDTAQNPEQ